MAIRVSWGHMRPLFGGGEGEVVGRSAMVPFERDKVVSYKLSIVTVALTIRPQFAIECLQRSNQQGVDHFGPKFPVALLGVDP